MLMTVVRKYHKAYNRVREGNFLLENLVGMNLHGKTVGIIGTGKIGLLTGRILAKGFGSTVIAHDPYPSPAAEEHGITYVDQLEDLLGRSDVVSLHCPLLDSTKYIINENTIAQMKKGAILINTSRGGLIDTYALIKLFLSLRVFSHSETSSYIGLSKLDKSGQSALTSTKKNLLSSSPTLVQRSSRTTQLVDSCPSTTFL
jgi:lactate dehydrogenase-like 2-hydroxyacid dehydrogenase